MKMIKRVLTLCLLVIISLVGVIGCNSTDKVEKEFGLDTFKEEMKSRGYDFAIEDIEPYFSSNESKTMKISEEDLLFLCEIANQETELDLSKVEV